MHFSRIIKLQIENSRALLCILEPLKKMLVDYLRKCVVTPTFFWIPIALAKIYVSSGVIKFANIPLC